jgi:Spy/CpxP family protein refolding chaperone
MTRNVFRAMMAALVLLPVTLSAQGGVGRRAQQGPPPDGRGGPPDAQRIAQMLRNQLQLSDEQAGRLQESNRKFAPRRSALIAEERQVRGAMRDLLCSGDTTRSAEVARSLDQLADLQKRRMAMFDEEQRELAAFLTPYQRARFLGFQDVLQNQLRGGGGRGARGGGGPPDRARDAPAGPPPAERQQRNRPDGPPPGGRARGGPPPVPAGCGEVLPPPG